MTGIREADIGEFTWADLAADGTYQLVVTEDTGRRFYNSLVLYDRDSAGKLHTQQINGWHIDNLKRVIRDLNGDGKDELIIPTPQFCATYRGVGAIPTWPAVSRLENGHYVEASRDFPDFYENEVLPGLAKQIAAPRSGQPRVWLVMERDQVLRMLGRNPTAGLRASYQWMNSGDPELRTDAAVELGALGGHDKELRALAADKNLDVALAARFAMQPGTCSAQRFNRWRSGAILNSAPN